ncbi:MAG: hypothetical protein Q9195_001580 [Heterodermia aff. obscurata]
MSYLGTLNSLLSTTTTRYNSLRRTLLSSSSEEADTTIDDPDSSHVSRVLRAYYTEKGRPFPPWLPPDPHARRSASPQTSFVGSAASLRSAGRSPGNASPAATAGGRGGGLSDLWADNSSAQKPQQDSGSLRRGLAGARLGRNRAQEPQQGQSEMLAPRPLPSQRAGSYQSASGQQGGSAGSYNGGAFMGTQPPGSSGSGGSVQERLKARLGGRGAVTPPLPREGSGGSMTGYDDAGETSGGDGGGSNGSSAGGNPYASGGYGSGDPYASGGGGGYDGGSGVRRKPPPGQARNGLPNGPRQR